MMNLKLAPKRLSQLAVAVTALSCLTPMVPATAQGPLSWSESNYVDDSTTAELYPLRWAADVAIDRNGNAIVVWRKATIDPYVFLLGRSTDHGETWTEPVPILEFFTSGAWGVRVVTDNRGSWLLYWHQDVSIDEEYDFEILCIRSTDNGETWSDPINVSANPNGAIREDVHPDMYADANGTLGAGWRADDHIYFARSTDGGHTWTEARSVAAGDDSILNPQLVGDGAGAWIVVWAHGFVAGTSIYYEIRLSRSVDNGQTWTEPAALSGAKPYDSYPTLTTDGEGNWIVVWQSRANSQGDADIEFVRSNDNGVTWTSAVLLNTNANTDVGNDGYPEIATDGTGAWVAGWSWTPEPLNSAERQSRFAISEDNGQSWTDPASLSADDTPTDATNHWLPWIATDGLGHWLGLWHTYPTSGTYEWRGDLVSATTFLGLNEVWVDFSYDGFDKGIQPRPFRSLSRANARVSDGGAVWILPGASDETVTLNRRATYRSLGGSARIGGLE